MSNEEMMQAIADSSGAGPVSPGRVRRVTKKSDRKKGGAKASAARELASLSAR